MRARLEGAMSRRRLRGWNPPLENINALVASGGPRLLARARELVVTNGYAANSCEAFAANLVGDGIKPSSLIGDADLRDRVQRLWLAWTDEADADGLTDFYGLQAMVAREMFVAGECFVRLRPRRAEDGLPVPLQLQLLQSEMLPFEKTETAANGNRIRCGIEFDAIGRRVAYHFRRRHPGDSTDQGGPVIPETVRVPAADVLHVYRPIDAGQIRGLPHVAPAMVRLFLLDQYDDAELDRKKTAAMFAGFITKTAPEEPMMGEADADPDGAPIASLEPGTMQVLLPGEDVRFSSPADVGGGYEAFQYRTLLAVSASLGLPRRRLARMRMAKGLVEKNCSKLRENLETRRGPTISKRGLFRIALKKSAEMVVDLAVNFVGVILLTPVRGPAWRACAGSGPWRRGGTRLGRRSVL